MTHRWWFALVACPAGAGILLWTASGMPVVSLDAAGRGAVLALALATLASEDLACLAAGVLVARGHVSFLLATCGCFVGIFLGDVALLVAGRAVGRPIARRWPMSRLVTLERLDAAAAWLDARGPLVICTSRFLPGLRLPTYVAAGVLGARTWMYIRWMALAAALWTPVLVGVSCLAVRWSIDRVPGQAVSGMGLAIGGLLCTLHLARACATRAGRCRLRSRWRRITRWEFWPAWVLYLPVVGWIAYLAVRHRCLTLFTAANPGIPAAGFVGESKSAILRALADGGAPVAAFTVLPAHVPARTRATLARSFAREHGLPVVLKPDQGQRGAGVRVVRSLSSLESAVESLVTDHVLQAYVEGPEYGLFYVRRPGGPAGRLISITAKELPAVTGDGRRTLDDLILEDPRAVALIDVYRRINADRLAAIPAKGTRVAICELGTHCRGAIFRDGRELWTPALERGVDEASRAMSGFSFGRFDVRTESEAALRNGRFRILELNGVTSEPTHIYDPSASVFSAWRTLASTWALAFVIGQEHAAAGARVWSVRELLHCVLAYRKSARTPRLPEHRDPSTNMPRAVRAGSD